MSKKEQCIVQAAELIESASKGKLKASYLLSFGWPEPDTVHMALGMIACRMQPAMYDLSFDDSDTLLKAIESHCKYHFADQRSGVQIKVNAKTDSVLSSYLLVRCQDKQSTLINPFTGESEDEQRI